MEERTLVPVALAYLRRTPAIPVLLVVVVAGAVAFGDTFLSARNFASMAVASSFLLIIAVGMTFVITSGGIDLSVGSMLALGAVLTAYSARWGSVPAIVLPLAVCTLIGLTQGLLIGRSHMPPFIVTLAGLLFARGLAFKVSDNGNTTHLIPDGEWVTALGQSTFLGIGLPAWIALIVLLVGMVLLYRTRFGFFTYAIGGSEEAALLMGVRVVRVKVGLYTLMGFLCGVSGLVVAARSSSGLSTIGAGLELKAIAAVVIGGTLLTGGHGGLTGTLAGVLLLGVIENLINQIGTLSSYYQLVASGVFLMIVVSAQSLFAKRELRRSGEVT
jgi:ribose transport system permease protein